MSSVRYRWEETGHAEVSSMDCECGKTIAEDIGVETDHEAVMRGNSDGTRVACDNCGRIYRFEWVGMNAVEVDTNVE